MGLTERADLETLSDGLERVLAQSTEQERADMRSDVDHFRCEISGGIARIALDRPERKNPLTFESYAELRDWFRDLHYATMMSMRSSSCRTAAISAPAATSTTSSARLTRMNMKELLAFTRMTGDLVKAMLGLRQAGHRGRRRHLCGRRRDHRHGL